MHGLTYIALQTTLEAFRLKFRASLNWKIERVIECSIDMLIE